jgi:hypothetical protein
MLVAVVRLSCFAQLHGEVEKVSKMYAKGGSVARLSLIAHVSPDRPNVGVIPEASHEGEVYSKTSGASISPMRKLTT